MSRPLPQGLQDRWSVAGWTNPGDRVIVAFSGGMDSMVLLHLLRFRLQALEIQVEAAHFDHRIREESAADARWVAGVATAWAVPIRMGAAAKPPADEAEARRVRYAFLEEVMRERKARWLLTAHHADDQVETILFRALRGTGVEGLSGMREARAPGLLRPLLNWPRSALEAYARSAGISPRPDPSNLGLRYARNRLRHEAIPALERVHPGAGRGILRLGRNAARTSSALEALLAPHIERVIVEQGLAEMLVDRDGFLLHSPEVQMLLFRALAKQVGGRPNESGTRVALEFIRTGSSGGEIHLSGGLRLARYRDKLRFRQDGRGDGHEERGSPGRAGDEG